MPKLGDRLRTALRGRYTIERELGRGGMATVYLAQDLRHHRRVAIKVLRPELAAAVGSERFLREIETTAQLTHPHILPLLDSGKATGVLYYVMPYVDAESLRDRLAREKQLPVEEALRIVREVADALTYAHSHDVVHRDIKPENILLESGHAVVADFGVARAITAAGGERLTETGIAVGTPAYMSPEQAVGSKDVDGRSDVYSLGCVLYEMLSGEPPYTASTPQAVLAKKLSEPLPRISVVRETVSPAIETALGKALARTPADRFGTADELAQALIGPVIPLLPVRQKGPRQMDDTSWVDLPRRRIILVVAATIGLALGIWVTVHVSGRPKAPLDGNLVAVIPFRVSGVDTTYSEGMVDLLAAKLNGVGGPRAASPQSVIGTWRRAIQAHGEGLSQDEAISVARRVGAGKLLLGSMVGTGGTLMITASMLDLLGTQAQVSALVQGPSDSLLPLVDQLTSRLLIDATGVTSYLTSLTSTSLPAVQAYLDGRAAYRRGRWQPAVAAFTRALSLDSTFALAALALEETSGWGDGPCWRISNDPCLRQAWEFRSRLAAPELAELLAYTGPKYPALSSAAEILEAREALLKLSPDDPEAWYLFGDHLFHWGAFLGIDNALSRAGAAFRQALALDSTIYVEPLLHLALLAAIDSDSAALRGYVALAEAADSFSEATAYLRWFRQHELSGSARQAGQLVRLDRMSSGNLIEITNWQGLQADAPEDARRALALLIERASSDGDRANALGELAYFASDAGRPTEADRAWTLYGDPDQLQITRVLAGLYWDADSDLAASAAHELARHVDGPVVSAPGKRAAQYRGMCAVEQWRLRHGQTVATARVIARLRNVAPPDDPETVERAHNCAVMLDAMYAAASHRSDAPHLLDDLDSLMRTGPVVSFGPANLVVARLYEARGDLRRALAAVRRGSWAYYWHGPPVYFTTYLREEGRLAALTGDTVGAIRVYKQFLKFRSDPEPRLRPDMEHVRAELVRLAGGGQE